MTTFTKLSTDAIQTDATAIIYICRADLGVIQSALDSIAQLRSHGVGTLHWIVQMTSIELSFLSSVLDSWYHGEGHPIPEKRFCL